MTPSMTSPRVSVVTPVYNGEAHLRECVESVLAQTYGNWDYTIVNNCSTDGTLAIAREYAARDPRIRVHDNDAFVRVIANHNVAFRQVSPESKYCKVVAADDSLFPDCLEKMVRLAEENPSVAIVGAYCLEGRKVVHDEVVPHHQTVVPGRDACRWRLLGGKYIFGAPTAVLFRSEDVRSREAFYNESNLAADSEVNFELLEHRDFGFVHQVLTYRSWREESLTSFSVRVNTYMPTRLYELVKYGPRYLTAEEQERRLRESLGRYYRYLASQLYQRKGAEFWSFHRAKLAEVGHPWSRLRMARAVVAYHLDLLLNPLATFRRLAGRFRSRSAERPFHLGRRAAGDRLVAEPGVVVAAGHGPPVGGHGVDAARHVQEGQAGPRQRVGHQLVARHHQDHQRHRSVPLDRAHEPREEAGVQVLRGLGRDQRLVPRGKRGREVAQQQRRTVEGPAQARGRVAQVVARERQVRHALRAQHVFGRRQRDVEELEVPALQREPRLHDVARPSEAHQRVDGHRPAQVVPAEADQDHLRLPRPHVALVSQVHLVDPVAVHAEVQDLHAVAQPALQVRAPRVLVGHSNESACESPTSATRRGAVRSAIRTSGPAVRRPSTLLK
jgi:glycosyltransferase involved in cell wall biosynthesis